MIIWKDLVYIIVGFCWEIDCVFVIIMWRCVFKLFFFLFIIYVEVILFCIKNIGVLDKLNYVLNIVVYLKYLNKKVL